MQYLLSGLFQLCVYAAGFQSLVGGSSVVMFPVLGKYKLQQDGGDDRGEYDHDDQRCHELLAHQSHGSALVGDDQSNLTTGYHADTDLQALFVGVAHDLCAQSAADDLGGNGNQHQQEHKDDQLAG